MRLRLLPAMKSLSLLMPLGCLVTASGADQPLGLVEKVENGTNGAEVVLKFDPVAWNGPQGIAPGRMIALYGAGVVEKHPLTDEVIITRPALVAKAQLIQTLVGSSGGIRARIVWTAPGQTVTGGMDAIPLPKEAAPNGPPALTQAPAPVTAVQGSLTPLKLAVTDPDGDAIAYTWTLEGPAGRSGRLLERTTTQAEVPWIAPLTDSAVELVGTAQDPLGQTLSLRLKLATAPAKDGDLKMAALWGGEHEPLTRQISRGTDGRWLGIANGTLIRYAKGWTGAEVIAVPPDQAPKKATTMIAVGTDLHILDGGRGSVLVLGADKTVKRTYGAADKATDLAVAADGTAYITDQAVVGVLVYEADGRLRCRLGGPGPGGFVNPVAVTLGLDGTAYVLDAGNQTIHRFDRFDHRIDPLVLSNDPADPVLDIALHPTKKALVLRTSGRMEVPGAGFIPNDLGRFGILDAGRAGGLWVDGTGETYVTYPDSGLIARYNKDMSLAGVRGSRLHQGASRAYDGQGRAFSLDVDAGTVLMLDPEGWLVGKLGARENVGGTIAKPKAVAVAADGSALSVLDIGRHAIHRFNPQEPAKPPSTFSQSGEAVGSLDEPVDLAMDEAGRTYVLDAGTYRVTVFAPDGTMLFTFGHKGKQADGFYDPERITVSPAGDRAWIYDSYNYDLKQFTLDQSAKSAKFVASGGSKGTAPGQFRSVVGLGCDRLNRLYVLDNSRDDLQVLDFTTGSLTPIATRDRNALGLSRLDLLAVSPDGTLLISGADQTATWRW